MWFWFISLSCAALGQDSIPNYVPFPHDCGVTNSNPHPITILPRIQRI